ncbi:type II secretion system protein J [Pontibacterium sp.]|uniref:PulJ/GspJ family protein n=1 Tax=Pontibacterium sp. TaxID=2036026 RepID=UPI0035682F2B
MRRVRGFTLVELIVVIVLLSIMSLVSVKFIANIAEGYVDSSRRQNMADVTQLAIERIGRELRNALPNSVRVSSDASTSCIEFIPVLGASSYEDLPVAAASDTFTSIPLGEDAITRWQAGQPLYVAVYPITQTGLYSVEDDTVIALLDNAQTFINAMNEADPTASFTATLSDTHQFPAESPSARFYVVGSPVSYCLRSTTGDLYRYENYFSAGTAFFSTQPLIAQLPNSEPNRALLASGISTVSSNPTFASLEISLQRNALVVFDMQVSEAGESVRIQHVVQVRNAP